ncbi:Eco57I restriction-modification methylase domain-containing protein [Halpernia frigidisoli]|uniref:site-specific DNA-methyltransferase (adenine-specific) n=1 Tax=Halpernia frigidisoli TaxID=1125876 RepID=A0A1I3FIU0_9FLAO|nr:N-6 DNA methylase [Halpernia frigidisoli]SFI11109.1 N-6 DNA Methylase [Halpernia frigidisoli]
MFQKTIISKYLKTQNKDNLISQWDLFCAHFQNLQVQENIKNSKEEQYQEGFFRDLFVNIFGYTLNPTIGFNLTTEYKNVKDSKKADGAIIIEDKVIAVIELKGTNTTDLGKIEEQAFNYKNNQSGCTYVITSNFEKIRIYIDDSVTFLEFNLFSLKQEDFNLLHLLLSFDNIKNNIPKKIKEESLNQEDIVTKKLYNDYSVFKRELFQNLTLLNPEHDPLKLFQKSQKLLDRLLFLFFGEDRGLLPPNSVRQILDQWDKLKEMDAYDPLYNRYKKYFGYLNTGFKGKNHDVFAYNGGLFKDDEVLDNIKIDDDLLYNHTFRLSQYDFASEVDVNILGHIFENSLNEIDEIKAQLEGSEVDKSKTKRKKDGVFYTPKYITKYIVENTVGKLCEEKKTDFKIIEEDYFTDKKRQQKTKENLLGRLDEYRKWLLQITIVDPACGSGAFLNEALNFLITEHQYIDELEAKLLNVPIIFSYHSESILEHNLFGVDLNEESVEIAKLSLWLRTAEPNRKLNSLNDNIKCGNSLIDDPEIAGEKAFNWEQEFPFVFSKGGFDVVIGNPPYGAELSNKEWLKKKYSKTSFGNIDSYKYFVQLGVQITKENGTLSYIMPDSYIEKEYFKDLRIFISNCFKNIYNVKLGDDVFDEVNLPTAIIILQSKSKCDTNFFYLDLSKVNLVDKLNKLLENNNYLTSFPNYENSFVVLNSIIKTKNTTPLIELYDQVMGVKVYQKGKGKPKQTNFEIDNDVFISKIKSDEFNYNFISQGIRRYNYDTQNEFIKYGEWLAEPRNVEYFDNPKIVIREIINPTIFATYIEEKSVVKNIAAVIIEKTDNYPLKYLLPILNSKLINFYVNEQSPKSSNKSYPSFNSKLLKNIPIVKSNENVKSKLINLCNHILKLHSDLKIEYEKFYKTLEREFLIKILSKKLQSWYHLSYNDFLLELKKQKVVLTLSQKADWETYFEQEKNKALQIQSQITTTDQEIDQMVYQLYGLTEEEIGIVENN